MPTAPAWDLYRRIKEIEEPDGSWPGGDVVDVLDRWLRDNGIDPETGLDELHTYRCSATVEVACPWPLDPHDVRAALAQALTGVGVRIEHEETLDTTWCETLVTGVRIEQ